MERNDNVAHTGYSYRVSTGNSSDAAVVSSRRYNAATPLSATTSLTAAFNSRGQMRFQHVYANDVLIKEIYSLGKLPIPFGAPHIVRANIFNVGLNPVTNLPVTLNITGANSFTDVQTIPSLAAGASVEIAFAPFTPAAQGNNTITLSIPNDDFNPNNTRSVVQNVNNNSFSYSYGLTPSGSVGFNNSTGDIAVKFYTSVATAISQVSVNFNTGGQPFKVAIWDTSGAGGRPGNLLFSSTVQTSTAGIYVLPILPAIPITAGGFFVGIQQTGTTNISFAYQVEDPIRLNTFYYTQPTGGTTWTDFAPASRYRFMIEPKLQLPIDANVTSIMTPEATCNAGPASYGVVISNVGLNAIPAGAANVTLKIGGANSFTGTQSNTAVIPSGGSEKILFTGVNLAVAGTNLDTAFVALAGDTEQSNDTLKTADIASTPTYISKFPAVENVETTLPVFPYLRIVSGSNQLWSVQTGPYSNADQTAALIPQSGNKFFLFDSYGGGSSSGFVSRLSSNCLRLPTMGTADCGYTLKAWISHDNTTALPQADSLYISVSTDNGVSWNRLLPGFQRSNASYAAPGWELIQKDLSAYAGQTIQVGFEGVSKSGNAFGVDNISIGSTAAQGVVLSPASNNGIALIRTCDDQGWSYYANPASPTVSLFAINWDPGATGANAAAKTTATVTIESDPGVFAVEDVAGKKATYTMARYWNVNTGATPLTSPVNIRFFYSAAEKAAVDNAAAAFATANAGVAEPATWFKTVGSDFMPDAAHVNADGVVNAVPLTDSNTTNDTINHVLYAEFDNVSSFSGGTYAAGVGPGTPLPVTLLNFDVQAEGKLNIVSWSTGVELNTSRFVVEHGTDGRNFSAIAEVAAVAGNGSGHSYQFTDKAPQPGTNYYRLRIVDADKSFGYGPVKSVRNEAAARISIYPNPVRGSLNLRIFATTATRSEMEITDLSGRQVLSKGVTVSNGLNLVPVDTRQLSRGAYVLKLTIPGGVIIQKFHKQ